MTIDVLIFGAAAEAARSGRLSVQLTRPNPTPPDILAAIADQHPALRFALSGARLAVNRAFAAPNAAIASSDEVALVSLVGGG